MAIGNRFSYSCWHVEEDVLLCKGEDTGIGIASADHERIFEKFAQVDSSSTRRYNGTGLGLAVVREYAELHGGMVCVESELGQGAAFTVRLPVAGQEWGSSDAQTGEVAEDISQGD